MAKQIILITAGGTGGHIFPALSVGLALQENYKIIWVGNKNSLEEKTALNNNIDFVSFSTKSLRGKGLLRKIIYPFILFKSILQSAIYILKFKPACVVGFGGFVSFPLLFSAKILGKIAVLHEQNSVPGMANKVLSYFVNSVLLGFSIEGFASNKSLVVGNPVRSSIQNIKKDLTNNVEHKLNIMIIGGSLGAKIFNDKLPEFLIFNENMIKSVVHQVGLNNRENVLKLYANAPFEVTVNEFIDDMANLYQQSDLIICRAGASTVAEVATVGIAAIFIPYLYAVDNHQYHNALHLVNMGGGILIKQNDLNLDTFSQQIKQMSLSMCNKLAINARKVAKPNTINEITHHINRLICKGK